MAVKFAISTPLCAVKTPAGYRLPLITTEWRRARDQLMLPGGKDTVELFCDYLPDSDRESGGMTGIDQACNAVIERARELGITYLFFLDYDVLVAPLAMTQLIYRAENNPDFDVFSGCYVTRQSPPTSLLWRKIEDGPTWDWTMGDVVECEGVPAGCMLIRMSVFDALEDAKPWFEFEGKLDCPNGNWRGKFLSPDLSFCLKVTRAGRKIMMDTGIQCGHIDNETGVIYQLPQDSLPARRFRETQKQSQVAQNQPEPARTGKSEDIPD